MKNFISYISLVLVVMAGLFVLNSCKQDVDQWEPTGDIDTLLVAQDTLYQSTGTEPGETGDTGDTNDTDTIVAPTITGDIGDFFSAVTPPTTSYTISNDIYTTFICNQGTWILTGPSMFVTLNDEPVVGNVDLEIIEIYTKGDMIRYKTPTISNGSLIQSHGEIYISATQNGDELKLAPGQMITIRIPQNDVNYDMQYFIGDDSGDVFNWIDAGPNSELGWVQVGVEWEGQMTDTSTFEFGFGYEILSSQLDWINCDAFMNLPADELTTVTVNLPERYTNINAVVFMVFDDLDSMVQLWGDPDNMNFYIDNMPIGENVQFVVITSISEDEEEYEFALVPAILEADHNETIIPLPATLEEIEDALNGL